MLLIEIKQSDFMTGYKFQEPLVQLLFLGTYFGSKVAQQSTRKQKL